MWTNDEINKLIELYPDNYNNDIAIILNKTKSSIDNKGYYLKLKKNNKLLEKRNNLGNKVRIDKGGRNLTFELLKKIASKYKTKIDFKNNDDPAYQAAINKGFLKKICEHMTVMKFSIPQLITRDILDNLLGFESSYNDRKIIKPYEIDIFYPEFNLGFEYQGIAWHKNNKNDLIKSKIAIDKGITIIYINEYTRNYETEIKDQIINILPLINKITKKSINKIDVLNYKVKNIYLDLYNKDELLKIAKNYKSFNLFKTNENTVYRKLCRMKLINEATLHMDDKKISRFNFSDEELILLVNSYDNLTNFRKEHLKIYKHIKRVKKDYMLAKLSRK